jgi:hypothetical protein
MNRSDRHFKNLSRLVARFRGFCTSQRDFRIGNQSAEHTDTQMVKLLSVIFFNCVGDREPAIVVSSFNLASFGFFEKSGVREYCVFASRECAKRVEAGNMQQVEYKGFKVCACFSS